MALLSTTSFASAMQSDEDAPSYHTTMRALSHLNPDRAEMVRRVMGRLEGLCGEEWTSELFALISRANSTSQAEGGAVKPARVSPILAS